jgi:hypothetical protein
MTRPGTVERFRRTKIRRWRALRPEDLDIHPTRGPGNGCIAVNGFLRGYPAAEWRPDRQMFIYPPLSESPLRPEAVRVNMHCSISTRSIPIPTMLANGNRLHQNAAKGRSRPAPRESAEHQAEP